MTQPPICPVCGNDSSPAFYAGESRMFRCKGCALAFVFPIPSEEYLTSFYSRFHTLLEEGGGYEMSEARMSADFPFKARKILDELDGGKIRLLDVGCGKGFFVKTCADMGIDAEGIDLSDTATRYATEKLQVKATCNKIENVAETLGQFDVVSFWATIEHLPNPIETLKAINRVLKPGGLLFMDTGIGNDWLDRLLPGFNQWYDPPQHLYVFSKKSIVQVLEQTGFLVKDINTNYERSKSRFVIKTIRGLVAAMGLRVVSELARCSGNGKDKFGFTRFPLGNLMSVTAVKK